MSDMTWHYLDAAQQKQGPITIPDLQVLVSEGIVTRETSVWTEALGEQWIPAANVEGLFPPEPTNPSPALRAATPGAPLTQARQPDLAPTTPMIASTPTTTAITAPAVQPPAPDSPYATPQANPAAPMVNPHANGAVDYPVPLVKKGSAVIYTIVRILGVLLILGAFLMVVKARADVKETVEKFQSGNASFSDVGIAISNYNLKVDEVVPFVLLGFFICLIGGLLALILASKAWACLKPAGGKISPGLSCLMLIPVVNFYWVFPFYVGLANQWNKITSTYASTQNAPKLSKGLFITHAIGFVLGTLSLCSITRSGNLSKKGLAVPEYLFLGNPYVFYVILILFSVISIIVAFQIAKGVNFFASMYLARGRSGAALGSQQGGGMKVY